MQAMDNTPRAEGTIGPARRGALALVGIDRPVKRNGFTPRLLRQRRGLHRGGGRPFPRRAAGGGHARIAGASSAQGSAGSAGSAGRQAGRRH